MRWECPHDKDKRIVNKFLLLPMRIGHQFRWLEHVRIKQVFIEYPFGRSLWLDKEWVD